MTYRPRRSVLFMPASNERALEKAKTIKADTLIFDLEDAVAGDVKAEARERACDAIRSGDYGLRELVVRVNEHDTHEGYEDIKAIAALGPDAILAPKVQTRTHIGTLSRLIYEAGAPAKTKLWVMIETPMAILNIREIAKMAKDEDSRLSCFVVGPNDLAKATGAQLVEGRLPMINWLSQCVLAARAYGVNILDGVYNDFRNMDGFRAECVQGLQLGMDGKTLIHPSQVDVANEVFAPSSEEVRWSRLVVEEFGKAVNKDKGAISLEGRMVERLHVEMAKKVVEIAEAIEALNKSSS